MKKLLACLAVLSFLTAARGELSVGDFQVLKPSRAATRVGAASRLERAIERLEKRLDLLEGKKSSRPARPPGDGWQWEENGRYWWKWSATSAAPASILPAWTVAPAMPAIPATRALAPYRSAGSSYVPHSYAPAYTPAPSSFLPTAPAYGATGPSCVGT